MKKVLAQQSVIDAAFNHNPHYVSVKYLIDAFIVHADSGTELVSLEDTNSTLKAFKSKYTSSYLKLRESEEYKKMLQKVGFSAWDTPIVKAKEPGYFVPAVSKMSLRLSKKDLKTCVLGWMFDNGIDAVDFLIGDPSANITTDPFTKKHSLKIDWDGLLQCDGRFQIGTSLFLKLDYFENTCGITFYTNSDILFDEVPSEVYTKPQFTLSSNDTISIKFEDESILDFNSIKKTNFSCILHQEDLDALTQKKIVATRISFGEGGKDPISMEFQNSIFGIYSYLALVLYFRKYVETIMEIHPRYNLPNRTIHKESQEYCYVYLMQDEINGYYKIGISNKPDYRERTLQSEKPSIKLIACKKYPTRKIAASIESALHTAYNQQHLRGEWFNLDEADVAAIIETLK